MPPELANWEIDLIREVRRSGDLDRFTEHYFKLLMSGTYYTPEDNEDIFVRLHELWSGVGKPDQKMNIEVDDIQTDVRVVWDPYYGSDPIFLLPHGFRILPWMRRLLDPTIAYGIAVTGAGSGKAQPLTAKVLTPDGWKLMGEIVIGSMVIGADGKPKQVLGTYPQGRRPVYRVTFKDGSSTEVDEEHLWLVSRRGKKFKVRETCTLEPDKREYIPLMAKADTNKRELPIPPYLIGALLGDGMLRRSTPMISTADPEILERISTELPDNIAIRHMSKYDYSLARADRIGNGVTNPLTDVLRELGLFGAGSADKFIPDIYKNASVAQREQLLQGLMDTDGSVSKEVAVDYSTASRQLALDVRSLVWSLGGQCTINKRSTIYTYNGKERSGKDSYRLYASFHNDVHPFWLPRKARKYLGKQANWNITRKVESIVYVGDKLCKCIRVEGGLYVTDDYIVTHNTCNVAIAALTFCALYPGFAFLNVAPTQKQAALMLKEIEKWCVDTEFRRFIVPSGGQHPLWIARPHPTITVEVFPGLRSTFQCQTVNRDAAGVQGDELDWINGDEAALLSGLMEMHPLLVSRFRGSRVTGELRLGKMTWISNPGPDAEFKALIDRYERMKEREPERVEVLTSVHSSENIYVTKKQLGQQAMTMSDRELARWQGGEMSAVYSGSDLGEHYMTECHDAEMDESQWITKYGLYDDAFGLREYEMPREKGRHYLVVGDVGESDVLSLSSQNIPCIAVFDVTNFMEEPTRMVALYWFDGLGTYKTFVKKFKHALRKYRSWGYYDATNINTSFEDFQDAFGALPNTNPVWFSGSGGGLRWSLGALKLMAGDGMFAWPYVKAMWYQAGIFELDKRKIAKDIISTLLVFFMALRQEGTLYDRLMDRYDYEADDNDDGRKTEDEIDDDWWDGTTIETPSRYERVAV